MHEQVGPNDILFYYFSFRMFKHGDDNLMQNLIIAFHFGAHSHTASQTLQPNTFLMSVRCSNIEHTHRPAAACSHTVTLQASSNSDHIDLSNRCVGVDYKIIQYYSIFFFISHKFLFQSHGIRVCQLSV